MNSFYKIALITLLIGAVLSAVSYKLIYPEVAEVYSGYGSRGRDVEEIQRVLKQQGFFFGEITGFYGSQTEAAVKRYQQYNELPVTGVADTDTLRRLGINVGEIPSASEANIRLLARLISAEARGEEYAGQVAVGAVIMNRIAHPSFPDTLAGVIYQNGEFSSVRNGQFDLEPTPSALAAARDVLAGWDPTGGAVYFFNPRKTSNRFLHARPVLVNIGAHRFCA